MFKSKKIRELILPILICVIFFSLYTILAIVRHNHFQSFGYDLGINDQTVWKYSKFELPLTTIDPFVDKLKLAAHVEIVYALIAPFYWIWSSSKMLIILQNLSICLSAIFVYKLARKYTIPKSVSSILVITYLMFFGIQFGLWTDVHSSVFGAAFVMSFIYFVDIRRHRLSLLFFLLAITAKETTGSAVFLISLIYFWYRRERILLFYACGSVLYMLFIFYIFFPHIMHVKYLYARESGVFSNLNPASLIDTQEKQSTLLYSFASWGFLPFLSPLMLFPILGHFIKFFVLASDLPGAQGIFGQYRVGLAPLLALSTIWGLKNFKYKMQIIFGIWLLFTCIFMQYYLHLPLSYLTKQWFWQEPTAVKNINQIIDNYLPPEISVVSQNNITPHISQRDRIYTLYPEVKTFSTKSICNKPHCNWFRWEGDPEYLIVDIDSAWDIRHFLADRSNFLDGLKNLENAGIIRKYKQIGNTILYETTSNPLYYK